ncbi:hypothetical protein AAEU28_10955 [Pseudoalteromonas sp. SS15]|uniref:hypothetical protein n=1 Tax=Pseudoalteromonas sp. SS15 TaxID=3139393 RepID=UPI003BAABD03
MADSNVKAGFSKAYIFIAVLLISSIGIVIFVTTYKPKKVKIDVETQELVLSPERPEPVEYEEPKPVVIKEAPTLKRYDAEAKKPKLDPHAPHPWLRVTPSSDDIKACMAIERKKLPYTEVYNPESEQIEKYYDFELPVRILVVEDGIFKNLNAHFEQDIAEQIESVVNKTIQRMFIDYIRVLGGHSLYVAEIKLWIAATDSDYADILTKIGAEDHIETSAGLYSPTKHLAISRTRLDYRGQIDLTSFLGTIAHETAHAFNFIQFGYMNRWSTEGIAEYYEYQFKTRYPGYFMSQKEWDDATGLVYYPLEFDKLLTENESWKDENRGLLYASAHAYIDYFQKDRPDLLKQILDFEQRQLCRPARREKVAEIVDPHNMLFSDIQTRHERLMRDYEIMIEQRKLNNQ